jgi:hypothetical protein
MYGAMTQLAKLAAPDARANENFCNTVADSGSLIVVGAYKDDVRASDSGSAFVFEKGTDGNVTQLAKLYAPDGAADDNFGYSVAVSDSLIVVGALANSGSAYVFEKGADGAVTQLAKLTAADGRSVAVSGSTVVVGARYDSDKGSPAAGAAYVFGEHVDATDDVVGGTTSSTLNGTSSPTLIMQKITEYSAEHDKVFARNQALTTEAIEVRTELANLREKREALINMTVDDPPLPVIDMSALSVDNVTVGENATSGLGDAAASTSTDAVDLVAEFQKAHDKVIADTTELQKEIDYLRVKRGEIVDLMVGHTPVPVVDCGSDASAAAARGAALGETPATNSTLIMEYVADYQTKHDEVIEKTKVVKEEIAHVNAIRDKIIKLNPAITIDVTGHEATTASALGAALRFSSSAALRVGAPALALAAVAAVAGAALSKSRLDRRRRVGADEETLLVEGTKYGAVHA